MAFRPQGEGSPQALLPAGEVAAALFPRHRRQALVLFPLPGKKQLGSGRGCGGAGEKGRADPPGLVLVHRHAGAGEKALCARQLQPDALLRREGPHPLEFGPMGEPFRFRGNGQRLPLWLESQRSAVILCGRPQQEPPFLL